MNARLLLVSSDAVLVGAIKAALDVGTSLLRVDRLDAQDGRLHGQFQPSAVIVDSAHPEAGFTPLSNASR